MRAGGFILLGMAYDVHFVSQDENPLGFALWQVSVAAQDAEEFAGEADVAADGVQDVDWHLLHRQQDAALVLESEDAGGAAQQAQALLVQAKAIAAGKDPHDAAAISAITVLHQQALALVSRAKASADDTTSVLEDRSDNLI